MIRVLLILGVIVLLGAGFAWIADTPGDIVVTWQGVRYETSLLVGAVALLATVAVLSIVWSVLRFVLRLPSLVSFGRRLRRRERALHALTRGMIAAGAGDARAARRASAEAERHLPNEPLTLLLKAQSAQLSGDRAEADRTFARMAEQPETRLLGLRGLHVEARRRGDMVAAHHFAAEAHALAPVDWAGRAVLEHHAATESWDKALAAVDANQAHKLLDRRSANRQRAVIKTAQAMGLGDRDPDKVIALARDAMKLAADLVPAAVIAGRALSRKGDIRSATKLLEAGWRRTPHPEIADAYLDVRPGDSARDRLTRAETLANFDSHAPESALIIARAALGARDFARARTAMAHLVGPGAQPTRRMCLMMADIEETENGTTGALREWLARAARAPRDAMWVADGVASETWAPVSPVTGRLDAYEWKVPDERVAHPPEPMPALAPPQPDAILDADDLAPRALPLRDLPEPPETHDTAADIAAAREPAAPAPIPAAAEMAEEPVTAPAEPAVTPAATAGPLSGTTVGTPPALRLVAAQPARMDVPAAAGSGAAPWPKPPQPVLFPQPLAPDDPGPRRVGAREDDGFL